MALSSPVAQVLVHTAIQWRRFAVKIGLDTPLFNALVFKKFKKAVGGHLVWALSGGGPLNGEVQEFIRVAFDVPLIQGYVCAWVFLCTSTLFLVLYFSKQCLLLVGSD